MKRLLIIVNWIAILQYMSSCTYIPFYGATYYSRWERNNSVPLYTTHGYALCEGLYLKGEHFLNNMPDYRSYEVDDFAAIREQLVFRAAGIGVELERVSVNGEDFLDQVWAVVVGNVPYVKYENRFYPITELGRLSSFFRYDYSVKEKKRNLYPVEPFEIPLPTHTSFVRLDSWEIYPKKRFKAPKVIHYVVDLKSGSIDVMGFSSLDYFIQNDPTLKAEMKKNVEVKEAYYSYFLAYNQRHTLNIPNRNCNTYD